MEGLNLRKISLKSDTYDFYTRIYPIGKDGITPEWLTGKDYIDNFQYSSKIKAYVWKDERYTNTTRHRITTLHKSRLRVRQIVHPVSLQS